MKRISGVMALHTRNHSFWLPSVFVLGAAFVINVVIGLLMGGSVTIYTGALASLYVYMLIAGAMIVKDTFPFALGMSVRRADYFVGTTAIALAVCVAWAVVLQLFVLIESQLTNGWGVGLHFFDVPYLSEGPMLARLWAYFAPLLFMYIVGFALACLYQRFGSVGLNLFFLATLVLSTIGLFVVGYNQWWGEIFGWLSRQTAAGLALWLIPIIVGSALWAYLLLRKAVA